ncbi:hypothetical protein D3C76_1209400 [compost metagenome]
MNASPTRNEYTSLTSISSTSARLRMPLSVTTRRSRGMLGSRSRVVSRLTSKVCRLRLLMPTSGVSSVFSARSSSSRSCTSTSTSRLKSLATAASSAMRASSRADTISRMQSAPMARASTT